MRIVVIGAPATGKSSVSRRVASTLGVPFVDTDREVEREYGPIRDIFANQGEEFFRAREREAVARALSHEGVISLGGGAVLNAETQADLAGVDVVLLTMTSDAARARITNGKRPLIGGIESWEKLNEERRHIYASLATATIDTSHGPLSRVVDDIVAWVRKRHDNE